MQNDILIFTLLNTFIIFSLAITQPNLNPVIENVLPAEKTVKVLSYILEILAK